MELARHDRSVLEDEEELERLVTVQQARKKRPGPVEELRRIFSGGTGSADDGNAIHLGAGGQSTGGKRERRKEKRDKRRERRREKAARRHRKRGSSLSGSKDEEGELMFEMEEGYRDDISEMTSSTSSDVDRGKANGFYGRPIDVSSEHALERPTGILTLVDTEAELSKIHLGACYYRPWGFDCLIRRVQSCQDYASRKSIQSASSLKWHFDIRRDDNPHLPRWFPRRLPEPRSDANIKSIRGRRRLTEVHDAVIS